MLKSVISSSAVLFLSTSLAYADPDTAIAAGTDQIDQDTTANMFRALDVRQVVGAIDSLPEGGVVAFWITSPNGTSREGTIGTPIYEGDTVKVSSGAVGILSIYEHSVVLTDGMTRTMRTSDFPAVTSTITTLSVLERVFNYTTRLVSQGHPAPNEPNVVGGGGIRG